MSTRFVLSLHVPGDPVPQGSLRSFERGGRVITKPNNAGRLERWRGDIRQAVGQKMRANGQGLVTEPVKMTLRFGFTRPISHLTSKGALRKGARALPVPDIDKLSRAVLDALTGVAFVDDGQVAELWALKEYDPGVGGVYISISEEEA